MFFIQPFDLYKHSSLARRSFKLCQECQQSETSCTSLHLHCVKAVSNYGREKISLRDHVMRRTEAQRQTTFSRGPSKAASELKRIWIVTHCHQMLKSTKCNHQRNDSTNYHSC